LVAAHALATAPAAALARLVLRAWFCAREHIVRRARIKRSPLRITRRTRGAHQHIFADAAGLYAGSRRNLRRVREGDISLSRHDADKEKQKKENSLVAAPGAANRPQLGRRVPRQRMVARMRTW